MEESEPDLVKKKLSKHLLSELKRKDELLRSAFENSENCFLIYDVVLDKNGNCIDFIMVDINNKGLGFFTIPKEELLGNKMSEVTPKVQEIGLFDIFRNVFNTGTVHNEELQLNLERFTASWIEITCVKLERGIFVSVVDITEKKQREFLLIKSLENEKKLNEESVRREKILTKNLEQNNKLIKEVIEKEARLSALINNNPELIFSIDQGYNLIEFNHNFYTYISDHYEVVPKKGDSVQIYNQRNVFTIVKPQIDMALSGKKSMGHFEYKNFKNDLQYIECCCNPIMTSETEIIGVVITLRNITQRKKNELALTDSELKFRIISQVSNDAIWDWDIVNNHLSWISGHDKFGELLNDEELWRKSIHEYDKERVKNKFEEALENPEQIDYKDEYRVVKTNGSLIHIVDKATILRDGNGKAIRMIGGMQDITVIREQELSLLDALETEHTLNEELAAREEELTCSEEELRQINEQLTQNYRILEEKEFILNKAQKLAKIGSWEYNLAEKTGVWSDEIYSIFNLEMEFVPNAESILQLFDSKSVGVLTKSFLNLVLTGETVDITLRTITKTRKEKWLRVTGYPIYEGESVTKISGIIHDITKFKVTKEKLKEAEEKFSKVFQFSPDLQILIREDDLSYVEVNDKVEEIAGYTKEEVIGKTLPEVTMWIDQKDRERFYEEYNVYGQVKMEATLRRKDNSVFDADIVSKRIEIQGNKHILSIISDITEKKSVQETIRKNEANLSTIINNLGMSIWSIDKNYNYLTFNNTFKTSEEEKYKSVVEIGAYSLSDNLPIEIIEYWKNLYDRAFQGEKIVFEGKFENNYYEYSINPIWADGVITGVTAYAMNLTQRKKEEAQIKNAAIELAAANKKIGEFKLVALRSVMNPHFIFNSLNSIQYFVAKNEKENAINYLSYFSKLIRGVLNNSVKNKINLAEELELIKYYISLELVRFDNKFKVIYDINKNLDIENIEIPSLLIQPYVENAILHGLYNKLDKGTLTIRINRKDEILVFEVEDDGIGRKAAQELKEKSIVAHKSMGMTITQERLKIINQESSVAVEINDLYSEGKATGTCVTIYVKIDSDDI